MNKPAPTGNTNLHEAASKAAKEIMSSRKPLYEPSYDSSYDSPYEYQDSETAHNKIRIVK